MNNWFDYILFHTLGQPETPAMVMEDRVVTYGMMKDGIGGCVRRITDLDLDRQYPVAVLVKNPIRHLILCLALFKIGRLSVSLEHGQSGIRGRKYAAVLGDRDASAVIDPENRLIEVSDEWFTTPAGDASTAGFTDPSRVCRVSLTSGATGIPKLVEHTVEEFGDRILNFININWIRVLCLPGLSSNFGFMTCCAALATGRTVCFAESPFQATRMIELFSIDFVMASTEQLLSLTRVASMSTARLGSLRNIWFGGSVPTRTLLEAATIHLCNNILCRYAASETGLIAQATAREMLYKPGLVGRVVPGVEVGIFDQAGRRCPLGKVGIVRVRPEADDDDRSSGDNDRWPRWTDLGDLGWVDSNDQLYVVGRVSDVGGIDTGELSPVHEIEHILRLEWDATDAAAVMVDDVASPEVPQVWIGIVGNKGANAERLTAVLRSRGFNYPIKLFDVRAIPRGSNGKVNRQQLRELIAGAKAV